jgi:hypothetical protein
VGAGAADDDSGYGSKVLTEYKRLKQVASGKNVPIYFPPAAAPSTTLAQKATSAPAKADTAPADTAHGSTQTGETVAGL